MSPSTQARRPGRARPRPSAPPVHGRLRRPGAAAMRLAARAVRTLVQAKRGAPFVRPRPIMVPGWAALAAALAASAPLAAQAAVPRPAGASLAASGFPEPFGAALLAVVAAGALGAVAADLVPDGSRLERWKRGEQGWLLRALGKVIVGSAAAVILLTLNPPAGGWAPLVGTALVAGLGGEALLVSVVSARRAADAERDRDALRAELARRRAEVLEKVESVGELAIAAYRGGRVLLGRVRMVPAGDGGGGSEPGPPAVSRDAEAFERVVRTAVERAQAELRAG